MAVVGLITVLSLIAANALALAWLSVRRDQRAFRARLAPYTLKDN